jgi:hypothetical protein
MSVETIERLESRPSRAEISGTSEVAAVLGALNEIADPAEALYLLDEQVGVVEGGPLYEITRQQRDLLDSEARAKHCDIGALPHFSEYAVGGTKLLQLREIRQEIINAARGPEEQPGASEAPVQYALASYFTGRLRDDPAPNAADSFITSQSTFPEILHALLKRERPGAALGLLKNQVGIFKGGTLRDITEWRHDQLIAEAKRTQRPIRSLEGWPLVDGQGKKLLELINVAQQIHGAAKESAPHKRNTSYGLNNYYISKLTVSDKALTSSKEMAVPNEQQQAGEGALAIRNNERPADAFEDVDKAIGRWITALTRGIYSATEMGAAALDRLIQKVMSDTRRAIGALVVTSMTSGNAVSIPPHQMKALAAAVVAEHSNDGVQVASTAPAESMPALGQEIVPELPQEETIMLAQRVMDHPLINIPLVGNGRTRASVEHVLDDGHTFLYDFDHLHEPHVFIDPGVWKLALELADNDINVNITSLTTSHTHAETSLHYKGLAIDLTFENEEQFQRAFQYLYDGREHLNINELILGRQLPPETSNLKNGQPHSYGQRTLDGHMGHIHVSVKSPETDSQVTPAEPEVTPDPNNYTVEQFMAAIASQESGGDPEIQNKRTNAHGYFQIMPSNWPKWSQEALGEIRERTPENQIRVAKFKMEQYFQALGSWEAVAIAWFAGPKAANDYVKGDESILKRSDGIWTVRKYVTNMQQHIGKIDPQSVLPILTEVLPPPEVPTEPAIMPPVATPDEIVEESPSTVGRVTNFLNRVARGALSSGGTPPMPIPDVVPESVSGKSSGRARR